MPLKVDYVGVSKVTPASKTSTAVAETSEYDEGEHIRRRIKELSFALNAKNLLDAVRASIKRDLMEQKRRLRELKNRPKEEKPVILKAGKGLAGLQKV